ncbi:MAG: hypothetical protein RI949_1638, partial [Pseudomonadota bacterium]
MSEVVISGVGISAFGKFPHLTEEVLAQFAVMEALRDAGITIKDVDAF